MSLVAQPNLVGIQVAKVLDRPGNLRAALFEEGQSQIVAGDARIELVPRRCALGRLDVAVGQDQAIVLGRIDDPLDAERQVADLSDLATLAEIDRRMIAGAAARPDKPLALAAQVDELLAGQIEIVQGDGGLQGRDDERGTAAQPRRDRDVAGQGHVDPADAHILVAVLEPEHGGLDVIAPVAGTDVNHVANPVAIHEVQPVAPRKPADEFRNAELDGLEFAGVRVDGHDLVVVAQSQPRRGSRGRWPESWSFRPGGRRAGPSD